MAQLAYYYVFKGQPDTAILLLNNYGLKANMNVPEPMKEDHAKNMVGHPDKLNPEIAEIEHQVLKNIEEEKKVKQRQEEESLKLIKKIEEEDKKNQQERIKNLEKQNTATCEICIDEIMHDDLYPIDQCGHVFHINCIAQHVKIKIKERAFPIICPKLNCKMSLSEIDVRNLVTNTDLDDFYKFTLEKFAEANTEDMSFCPTPDCKYLFIYNAGIDSNDFTCPVCQKRYCLNCRCLYHVGMTCKEYKINANLSEEDKQFIEFVKGKKYKQCPKCKFWVEKNQV